MNTSLEKFFLLDDPNNTYPWRRYWARMIDYLLWGAVLETPLVYISSTETFFLPFMGLTLLSSLIVVNLTWIPLEALFLTIFGSTPGKWMLGIKILNQDGSKIKFPNALSRSWRVWVFGTYFCIPVILMIAFLRARTKLVRDGITTWDKSCKTIVSVSKMHQFKVALIVILTLAASHISSIFLPNTLSPTFPAFSEVLNEVVMEINKAGAQKVDEFTILNGAQLESEDLILNYSVSLDREHINFDAVKTSVYTSNLDHWCKDLDTKILRDHSTKIVYRYIDKNGNKIGDVVFDTSTCIQFPEK